MLSLKALHNDGQSWLPRILHVPTNGRASQKPLALARHALRELRPKQGRSPLRVLYVYDPERQAILILGGDKGGDERWDGRAVPKSDDLFDAYLAWQAKQKENER